MTDTKNSKTLEATEEFKFWVMGVTDRRTAIAELCAMEREYNLPQCVVQELFQYIKTYFPTIPPISPISIKIDQETTPDSSMAKTLRNMRATGITRREIPAARKDTVRGIPKPRGATAVPPPKPARKASLVFGTPERVSGYSVQNPCDEERIF